MTLPTLFKRKIPSTLSYPIGAERISQALASVPQYDDIGLEFWYYSKAPRRAEPIEFLKAEYNTLRFSETMKWSLWTVRIQPVPREARHLVQQHILQEGLPAIAEWLCQRAGLNRRGSDRLVFRFNPTTLEFTSSRSNSLQPERS
jgi:hypothetical protein